MNLNYLQQYGTLLTNIEHIQHFPMKGKYGETVSAAAKRIKWNGRPPDAIINAELFHRANFQAASGLVTGGKVKLLTPTLGFALVNNVKPVLSYQNNVHADDWISGYPPLLQNGKRVFTKVPIPGNHAWSALAYNDTHFAYFYVKHQHRCKLVEFCDGIAARGFHTAIAVDGGGSTACITPLASYDQGRKISGFVCMWIKGGTGNRLCKVTR